MARLSNSPQPSLIDKRGSNLSALPLIHKRESEGVVVMVFGVFDGLHEGHRHFLNSASTFGKLIIVVARDTSVKNLKHKIPKYTQEERMAAIRNFMPAATVILGDEQPGAYEVVKTHRPAMICLGHDQVELGEDLQAKIDSGYVDLIQLKTLRELP